MLASAGTNASEAAHMSRSVEVFQVDAFTRRRFTGNPAGVVLGAEALDEAEMLSIARELNNGDTAFVLPPSGPDHDFAIRFFTPRAEAAFVGHATLAAHAVLAQRDPRPLRTQHGRTGLVPVQADGTGFSIAVAPTPPGRSVAPEDLADVLAALGMSSAALDPDCAIAIAGTGSTRLLLPVGSGESLAMLDPDLAGLGKLSARIGAAGYFLFSRRPALPGCDVESRMFCPALGIPEDPVSGNAHGMLGCHLLAQGLLTPEGETARFRGAQGHHLRRPGRVDVQITAAADRRTATGARIRGDAVIVFGATLQLD
jgi:PhzF family phenazine biosynthesis protein